jgi:hypothetical protein
VPRPAEVLVLRDRSLMLALPLVPLLAGCWKEGLAELPPNIANFEPAAGRAEDGWLVEPLQIPGLICPDGELATFFLLYHQSHVGGEPVAAATLYHAGAFDYVFAPEPSSPLDGTHFATPERLTSTWATRQVFATLGMYPDQDVAGADGGSVALALTEQDVAVMLPANCWGDLWHNAPGLANNNFDQDFFYRNGASAADWGYRLLADPTFGAFFGVELPISIDAERTYAIGLGSGGRGVGEMLALRDRDGAPTFAPVGVVVDSSHDDLRFFFDDPTLYGPVAAGLARIFPTGRDESVPASLAASPSRPARFGYVFSDVDPVLPQQTFAATAASIGTSGWLYVDDRPAHGVLNRADSVELARQAVSFLLTGTVPPPGPGVAPSLSSD